MVFSATYRIIVSIRYIQQSFDSPGYVILALKHRLAQPPARRGAVLRCLSCFVGSCGKLFSSLFTTRKKFKLEILFKIYSKMKTSTLFW
jgi:hypothetical protein